MRAVVFAESGFALAERPVPVAGPGKVLVKVDLCGICGTDLHAYSSGFFTPDVIIGHEFAAVVEDVGEGVTGIAPGDRVVVNPTALACGACDACLTGLPNLCLQALGELSLGMVKDGGMAEFAAVDAVGVHAIPAGLAAETAAWAEPLAVAVRGVGHGEIALGERVLVLGAGPIGQLTLQVARAAGAATVDVVETSAFRRRVAVASGAATAVGPDAVAALDPSYDVVFDCTGAPPALGTAVDLVGYGGRIVAIGSYTGAVSIETPLTAQLKEVNIKFSLCYRDREEFATALRLLADGAVDVEPLTQVMPLARHAEAFAALRDPEAAIKVLLDPRS